MIPGAQGRPDFPGTGPRRLLTVLLASLLLVSTTHATAAPSAEADQNEQEEEQEENSFEVGLRGNLSREANESGYEWGPTVSLELFPAEARGANRFRYSMELSFNDSLTRLSDEDGDRSTRVQTAELRYAKVHAVEVLGFDIGKRLGVIPYVAGGVQHVDSRETSPDESTRQNYWSPTWATGLEVALNKKLTLALDYERNGESGNRRVSRFSVELKLNLFK